MKIYGYTKNTLRKNPSELSEATLSANPVELRELADFLEKCATEIEQQGSNWEHEHFRSDDNNLDTLSLIIFNSGAEQ